jgi:hypothetical protein
MNINQDLKKLDISNLPKYIFIVEKRSTPAGGFCYTLSGPWPVESITFAEKRSGNGTDRLVSTATFNLSGRNSISFNEVSGDYGFTDFDEALKVYSKHVKTCLSHEKD